MAIYSNRPIELSKQLLTLLEKTQNKFERICSFEQKLIYFLRRGPIRRYRNSNWYFRILSTVGT